MYPEGTEQIQDIYDSVYGTVKFSNNSSGERKGISSCTYGSEGRTDIKIEIFDKLEETTETVWLVVEMNSADTVPAVVKTTLDNMNLTERFLFDETAEDQEVYNAMVEIIMGEEITLVNSPETEKELRVSPELRQIRLDVIGTDQLGHIYQITTILVAPFDIFGYDLYRYTFQECCEEVPDLRLNDGAKRIFINIKGKNPAGFSREFLDFMDYINSTTDEVAEKAESERIKKIHNRVKTIKASEKMGVKLMQKWEELAYAREDGWKDGRQAGIQEGIEKGIEKGILATYIELLKDGLISPMEVAKRLQLSVQEVEQMIK